jgi:hypothetical protein
MRLLFALPKQQRVHCQQQWQYAPLGTPWHGSFFFAVTFLGVFELPLPRNSRKKEAKKRGPNSGYAVWILSVFFFFSDAKFKPAARDAKNGKQAGRRRRHGQHSAG